jgi:hypothetical protein
MPYLEFFDIKKITDTRRGNILRRYDFERENLMLQSLQFKRDIYSI